MTPTEPPPAVALHVPVKTILRVLAALLTVYVLIKLSSLMMTLFFAAMLAITVYPLFDFLRRRRIPRWIGVLVVVFGLAGGAAAFVAVVLPPLVEQTSSVVESFPKLRKQLLTQLPPSSPLHAWGERALGQLDRPEPDRLLSSVVSAGQVAFNGVTQVVFVLIFTVYLLVDGPRTVEWLLAFFSAGKREKLQLTAAEMSKVISAYVAGQVITSLICGVYTFVALSLLHVPEALMLAVIAAVFDVLPVLGFFIAAVPAVVLSLAISPYVAAVVITLYIAYHAIENYLLAPKIYGSRLRLSDLVVLVSLAAAGLLAGFLGAIAVLPLVASYPIIERIWLVDLLGRSVVKKHADAELKAEARTGESVFEAPPAKS